MSSRLLWFFPCLLLGLNCGSRGNDSIESTSGNDLEQSSENTEMDDSTMEVDSRLLDAVEETQARESLEIVELGTVSLNDSGSSSLLTVSIPEDAISFSINVIGTPGVFFAVDALRNPQDKQLIVDEWYNSPLNGNQPVICVVCINRIASGESAHSILVPNTPVVEVVPGEYSFRIYGFVQSGSAFQPQFNPSPGQVDVSVVIKRSSDGAPEFGFLNLNLHFTGAGGMTAANAASHERLQTALKTFAKIYAGAGIGIGTLTYRDLDEGFQVVDGFSKVGNDFEEIAKLTADNPPGVNLVFVRELMDSNSPIGGFGVILGISGGIPGPSGIQGTSRSAVIIATDTPSEFPTSNKDLMGPTMAHEIGHYLGLFHSSELGFGTQQLHDHLQDTPQNDTSNLMYYDSSSGGIKLSKSQGYVLRNNPWVNLPPKEVTP